MKKRAFYTLPLERGVKTGGVYYILNGVGNSKGLRGKARCSTLGAGKAASSASGLSPQAGGIALDS